MAQCAICGDYGDGVVMYECEECGDSVCQWEHCRFDCTNRQSCDKTLCANCVDDKENKCKCCRKFYCSDCTPLLIEDCDECGHGVCVDCFEAETEECAACGSVYCKECVEKRMVLWRDEHIQYYCSECLK